MVHPDDHDLCRRIRAGDAEAENLLVSRHQAGLLALARVRAGRDAAGDLVQETLAAALVNLRRGAYRGEGPLAAYLAAILRRAVLRWRAGVHPAVEGDRLEALPDPAADTASEVESRLVRARLREALESLPRRHREVLLRHYVDGETAGEIASALGVPRGTVLSRLHHGRRKLAKAMNRIEGARHYAGAEPVMGAR
jgi:RNA polymerase sigma-70 factor (ECF subfamily)